MLEIEFSVLISIYKNEQSFSFIESMNSIISQTLQANEIILVIDGPIGDELQKNVDYFKSLLPKILKIKKLIKNIGLGKALNIGLKECTNEIVIRMDTDDICMSNRFEKLINTFIEHPDYDVIGSWIEEFIETPRDYNKIRRVEQLTNEIYEHCKSRNPMNHPSVAFKKSKVIEAGGYKHFPLMEDYFLWYRMLKLNNVFYNIQEPLMYLRIGNDMVGRRWGFKYFVNEYHLFYKMYDDKFINLLTFIKNLAIRLPLRILPKPVLKFCYKHFFRI